MTIENVSADVTTEAERLDEQLVAYLDGELAPAERQQLEERLLATESLRLRLRELQGGWQLLDELPKATVSDRFTQTTLELVAADVAQEAATPWAGWRRIVRPLAILLATIVAGGIGMVMVMIGKQAELRRQLADLPLAEHLDAYLVAGDLQWLTQVSQDQRWQETIDAAEVAGAFGPAGLPETERTLADTPVGSRAEALLPMDDAERSRLDSAWQRFQNLPPAKQEEVRQRAAHIARAEHPEQLLRTLDAYARFRANWSAETRMAIESGSPQARDAAFSEALSRSRRLWLRQLTDADAEAVYGVLHVVAGDWLERMRAVEDNVPSMARDQIRGFLSNERNDSFEDREAALLYSTFVRRRGMSFFRLRDDDFYAIKSVLSDPMREALDKLMPTPEMQEEVMLGWAIEAVQRKTKPVRVDTLLALDPEDRLDVELSPPQEMFLMLQRKSREEQNPFGSPRGPAPPRRGGRFER